MDLLDHLLDHGRWATSQLLEASGGLSDAHLDQPLAIGNGTLRVTFDHMIGNVAAWAAFLAGQPAADQRADDTLATLIDRHERGYAAFASVARRLRDEQRLDDTYVDAYAVRKSFGGTILMVIEHNVEHRTEARHMLIRLGVPDPPEIDFGVWDYRLHNH